MNLLEEAKKHYSEQIYSITADLHAHPELSFEEKRTSAIIRAQLEKLGIEILDLGLETGVVGLLRGRGDATIALRADIDAIVQHEEYDRPDKSLTPGVMHGCGHDTHTAGLLGAAMLLSVFWVFVSSEMIWRVEITGAGENIAEVRRCLARENARVGRLKKRVSTDRLAAELALAVPGLSHAAARYEGSTLVVACQQAREGERAGVDGTGRDIVAAREGIIIRISAESGTPQVKAGQAVREGQTLIAGQERTGGGNLRALRQALLANMGEKNRLVPVADIYLVSGAEPFPPDQGFVSGQFCQPDSLRRTEPLRLSRIQKGHIVPAISLHGLRLRRSQTVKPIFPAAQQLFFQCFVGIRHDLLLLHQRTSPADAALGRHVHRFCFLQCSAVFYAQNRIFTAPSRFSPPGVRR